LSEEYADRCLAGPHEADKEHGACSIRRVKWYRLRLGHRTPRFGLRDRRVPRTGALLR
jgi:hypothetical protein